MKAYRVIAAIAQFGFGERIAVTPAQFRSRSHALTRVGTAEEIEGGIADEAAVLVEPTAIQTFKRGEIIGLSEVPKAQATALEELKPAKGKKHEAEFRDAVRHLADGEARKAQAAAAAEAAARDQAARDQAAGEQWTANAELQKQFKTADEYVASLRKAT